MVTQNQSKVPDGTLLEGKFRVTREIGRGGMAAVYEAENVDIGKRIPRARRRLCWADGSSHKVWLE